MTQELQFDHIGLPVDSPQAEEFWVPDSECWVTNPRTHPQRIEYLRFKSKPDDLVPGSPLWKLWNMPHVAYRVDDLEAAIEGEEVVYGPFEPSDFGRVVFIHQHGLIVEFLEYTDLNTWFGVETPWEPA
ncbi:MAG: hypothetical protein CMJ78_27150 [Planctomycetaceae bacterium]|nr:hypothetical protein [Planctomycetaceae bacterium]